MGSLARHLAAAKPEGEHAAHDRHMMAGAVNVGRILQSQAPWGTGIDTNGALRLLSSLNHELIELLRHGRLPEPAGLGPAKLVPYLPRYDYGFSIWPIFVDAEECRRRVEPVIANLPRIFHAAIRARFGDDSAAFAAYFGWPRALHELLLAHPVDPRDVFGRYDAVLDGNSLKLLEFNVSTSAGGWECGDWMHPTVRDLFAHDPRSAVWEIGGDTIIDRLFDFLIDSMRRHNGARRGGHLLFNAVGWPEPERAALHSYLQQVYDRRKPPGWPPGRVFLFANFAEMTFPSNGDVRLGGQRMDAVILAFPPASGVPTPVTNALTAAYLRGGVVFPDSPLHMLLGDKRLLALVHACCRDGLLDPGDRALVERHVPWSALLDDGEVACGDLWRRREQLVLKRSESFGGRHVVVGCRTSAHAWDEALAQGSSEGGWIVQEYCAPGRLDLHDGQGGIAEHDLIWGLFGAGTDFGWASVRARRSDGGGVINATAGATTFLVLPEPARPPAADTELATATAALSARNLQLASMLERAGTHPAMDEPTLPLFLQDCSFPVSRWPVFVADTIIRRHVEPLASALPGIVYRAILARFRGAPDAFVRYFGWPPALLDLLVESHPDPRDTMIRYDAVMYASGVRLLEINCCSSIGGWLLDWYAPASCAALEARAPCRDWNIAYRAIFEHMLGHVFDAMQRLVGETAGHVLVHADSSSDAASLESFRHALQEIHDRVRPQHYASGRILVCTSVDQIAFDASGVHFDGHRVDAVLLPFAAENELPDALYDRLTRASLRRQVVSADTHVQRILGDKRLLALLHDCLLDGKLALSDAAIVERYVPWTVCVVPGAVELNGENAALPVLLRRDRPSLVLKKASSFGGRNVVVGRATSGADWARAIERALSEGDWIAQEYCAPARQLAWAPEVGLAAHELVWGLFAFGGTYAGSFVRARRVSSADDGVINSANGATEFVVFEDHGDAAHDGYSPLNGRLAHALESDPAMRAERLDLAAADTVELLRGSDLKISAWPLFVDKDFARRRFGTIVEAIPRILYKAVTAYFGDDAQAFSEYLGQPRVLYDLLRHAPVDLRDLNARYDTSVTADSVRILEINCSSAAGGFQHDWVEPHGTGILRRHRTTAGWRVRRHVVFRSQLQALIASMLRRRRGNASGHILMYAFTRDTTTESLQAALQAVYDEVRPPELAGGRIHLFRDFSAISFDRSGDVRYAGFVVDAVLFTFPNLVDVPEDVYRRLTEAYLGRGLVFPDSPLHLLLDSKLQLALVHECCELGLLDADERAIVQDTIPWASTLRERDVVWRGEHLPLSRLLLRERERFVLKKATSFGGRDVIVGRHCGAQEWRALLTRHLEDRDWLAQEYCPPGRTRLYDPALGMCEHDLVWGVFTFGGRYGGTFLRGKPACDTNGVINTVNGATEILVYAETG